MNIKTTYVKNLPSILCSYEKELVHLQSFNNPLLIFSVSYQETEFAF